MATQTHIPLIVQSVFGIAQLEDVPSEELHILTAKYPYCAPLHLLYARRLRDAGDRRYAEAAGMAAIHFSNPHWLQHQLRAELSAAPWKGERLTIEQSLSALSAADGEETASLAEDAATDLQELLEPELPEVAPMTDEQADMSPIELEEVEALTEETPTLPELSPEVDALLPLEVVAMDTIEENVAEQDTVDEEAVAESLLTQAPEATIPVEIEKQEELSDILMPTASPSEWTAPASALIHVSMPGDEAGMTTITPEDFTDRQSEQASRPRQEEVQDLEQLLEPLHVTDYFASQGIEVSHDLDLPLNKPPEKTFMGWLRTMKRMQAEKNAVILDAGEEEAIRTEAEASNQDEDVLTEAMADVYAQQRLTRKAIAIYEKLSLLNPDKSATFAARIEKLKGTLL